MIRTIIVDNDSTTIALIQELITRSQLPIEIIGVIQAKEDMTIWNNTLQPQLVFFNMDLEFFCQTISLYEEANINFIALTETESFACAKKALQMGAKDILLKPILEEDFMHATINGISWKFTSNTMVNYILEYVSIHYKETIEINQLAQNMYTTPSYIARIFKKHMGMSLLHYIHAIRIEEATYLLNNTTCSIKEIAGITGYTNLNNFYKHFREHTHMTPHIYRQKKSIEN